MADLRGIEDRGISPPIPRLETPDGWLAAAKEVYVQGVTSRYTPDQLRTFGGTLKLAARDCQAIRSRSYSSWLGWGIGQVDFTLCRNNARDAWAPHEAAIRGRIAAGQSLAAAAIDYYHDVANALPESGAELAWMAVDINRAPGRAAAYNWDYSVERDREIIQDYGTLAEDAPMGSFLLGLRDIYDPPRSMEDIAVDTEDARIAQAFVDVSTGTAPLRLSGRSPQRRIESKPQERVQHSLEPAGPTTEHVDVPPPSRRPPAAEPSHTVDPQQTSASWTGAGVLERGLSEVEPVAPPRQAPSLSPRAIPDPVPTTGGLPAVSRPSTTRTTRPETFARVIRSRTDAGWPVQQDPAPSRQIDQAQRGLEAPASPAPRTRGSVASAQALPQQFEEAPAALGPHDPGRKPEVYFRSGSQIIDYLRLRSIADSPAMKRLWQQALYEMAISEQKTAMKKMGTRNRQTGKPWGWVYTPQNNFQKYLVKLATLGPASPQITNKDVEDAFNDVRKRFNQLYKQEFGEGKEAYDVLHHWNLKHTHPLEAFLPANLYPLLREIHDDLIHGIISEGTWNYKNQAERFVIKR